MLQKKLPVAVDIGANVGGFCINAYPHFDKIYAFEPYLPNYNILLQVINKLNITNIESYNTAIYGESNKELPLTAPPNSDSGGIRCCDAPDNTNFVDLQTTCTSISLSDMMETLGLQRINYLKLDCEGSEYSILENFYDYHKISMIAIELHGCFGVQRKENLLYFLNEFYYIVPLLSRQEVKLENIKKLAISDFKQIEGMNNFFCLNREALQT